MIDQIVTGVFTLLGTLLGVALGLFGERWVRTWGEVRCVIEEDDWYGLIVSYSPEGGVPKERRLRVAFLNRKDLPVTVWDMHVEFYKGRKQLEEWARPAMQFVDERDQRGPVEPVNLPPHVTVTLALGVVPGRDDQLRELEDADRAVFVARLMGAEDKRRELAPPWREPAEG